MSFILGEIDGRVLKNISSLTIIQGINYLIPLIILPYLIRILGVHGYGILTFCIAIVQYFLLFTQFGFNFSATQRIAEARENKRQLSQIFFQY